MVKLIVSFGLIALLSACSIFSKPEENELYIENIATQEVRFIPNEELEANHEDIVELYQRYLDVSVDSEMRVRVAHRIAGLKLQAQEIAEERALDSDTDTELNDDIDLARSSIKDYEDLLKTYPDRVDNDVVLYQLAKAYSLTGQPYQAIAVLDELALKYPRSDYYLEAEFRLGQLLYAAGDYEAAANAYGRLIERGSEKNTFYTSAGYLRAWAIFKQEKNKEALLEFSRVLDEEYPEHQDIVDAEGGDLDMLNDIIRIMAIIFDYMGDWKQIAIFYEQYGARHYEYLIYDQLATQYYEKKYYKSGASTLRAFVTRYPNDVLAPRYYSRIIEGYTEAGYINLVRKHKKIFIQRFGVEGEFWQKHSEAVRASLIEPLAQYNWDLASFHHAYGQSRKNPAEKTENLLEAQYWYAEYVRSFPNREKIADAHFLLAEVSYELGQYRLAKDNYEIVAYQYPEYEKASEAGYAAILSFNKYKPSPEEGLQWRQLTVASAMRFVQEFTEDERRGKVLVNTSEMLLKDKYYKQALNTSRLAWQIKGDLPERYQHGAALVRGHSSFELEKYDEAQEALLIASQYSKLKRKKRQELRQKVAAAIYQKGKQAKERGDTKAAIDNWLNIAQVIPESDIKVSAEYDSATLLMEIEEYERAIEVLLDFKRKYPDHPLTVDIPSKLILAYEGAEDWRSAAFELQAIWKNSKDQKQQRIACFQSAEYFEKAEDYDNAIVMYKRYAHRYKQPFDPAIEAHFKLDQMYAAKGSEEKRRYWLDKVISLHNKAGKDQTDRSKYLAAKAAYELGEFERARYEQVKLTLPLDKSVTKKNGFMQDALKRYTQSVQLEVLEFTTSSTYRIGELYGQLSRALMESERPPGMDEVEAEEYQFLLEDQAFPLEEAAIEVHQTNTGRTYDGLYDQWIKQSYRSLAGLMPGQYNKQEKALNYVDQIR